MEDVDRMIFDFLCNELRCSFRNKTTSLADFGSEEVVEAIVRCIWRCRPGGGSTTTFPSYQMPGSPIERFRLASKISREIQAIGVREQVGYQALLYPNVFDNRRIFLSLFERFPKETIKPVEKTLSPLEKLKAQVGEAISDQFKIREGWTPEFCRFYDMQRIGRYWYSTRQHDNKSLNIFAYLDNEVQTGNVEEDHQKAVEQKTEEQTKRPPIIGPKPKLPTKPRIDSSFNERKIDAEPFTKTTPKQEHIFKVGNNELQLIKENIELTRANLSLKGHTLLQHRSLNVQITETIGKQQSALFVNRRPIDERLLKLLLDPNANVQKLQHYLSEANERRVALEQKYFEAEREQILRMEHMGAGGKVTTTTQQMRSGKMAELRKGIGVLEQMLAEQLRIKQKLQRECQKMAEDEGAFGEGVSRAKYVRRILEISTMVGKQNEEIRRTANSVQSLRREIDLLMGGLERTFIAVDSWLSKHAEANSRMARAYKLLVRTHEQCAFVKECIEGQGQISRQMDELNDKIGMETQKLMDEQLERLLDDLMLIKHENIELEKMLKGMEAS